MLRRMMKDIESWEGYQARDGLPLYEAVEQLLDEAMTYERRPSKENYQYFKRSTMSVEIQSGSSHLSDRPSTSPRSILISSQITGDAPQASLLTLDGSMKGRRFLLGPQVTIGRSIQAQIHLPHPALSRRHAQIFQHEGHYVIQDLGSTNTTLVNGLRIRTQILQHGDEIRVGDVLLRFEVDKS